VALADPAASATKLAHYLDKRKLLPASYKTDVGALLPTVMRTK
jgi:hypothetical protein